MHTHNDAMGSQDGSGDGNGAGLGDWGADLKEKGPAPPHVAPWGHHKRGSDSGSELSLPGRLGKSLPADPQVSDVNSVSLMAVDSGLEPLGGLAAAISGGNDSPSDSPSAHLFDNILSSLTFSRGKDAAAEREFHSLFKLIPADEKLLGAFPCSLNRGPLYEGTVYLTHSHLCFNSSMLDWVAQIQMDMRDIVGVSRQKDELCVTTSLGETRFAQFERLDEAYNLLRGQVDSHGDRQTSPAATSDFLSFSVGLNPPLAQKSTAIAGATAPGSIPKSKSSIKLLTMLDATGGMTNEEAVDRMIRSIDDSGESAMDSSSDEAERRSVRVPVYKLRADSASSKDITYAGPWYNDAKLTCSIPTRSPNEHVLADIELSAAPGLVFQILFNEHTPTFLHEFLSKQDSSKFTDIGAFALNESGVNTRTYSYQKQLHFPVGPSTTLCNVEEAVLHHDLSDYIELVNTTRTPNVPSGGNFATKTRYIIQWHERSRCRVRLSFWVEWTGSSWIKNMVESSCKTGLVASTVDFVNMIERFVAENVHEEYVTVGEAPAENEGSRSRSRSKTPATSLQPAEETEKVPAQTEATSTTLSRIPQQSPLVVGLLIANIVLFLILIYVVYSLDRKVRLLLHVQGYASDRVAQATGGLYEMPVRGDATAPPTESHTRLLQSLKALFGPLTEANRADGESPRDLLQRLLNLIDRELGN